MHNFIVVQFSLSVSAAAWSSLNTSSRFPYLTKESWFHWKFYCLKKRLSPGDFTRLPKIVGPGNKKTVTTHATCSIRWHPALIGLEWESLPYLTKESG